MSDEKTGQAETNDPGAISSAEPAPRASLPSRRARPAWWFKLFMQPFLAVAALATVVFAIGLAQRTGMFGTTESATAGPGASGEEVLYICPMFCVEPTTEPGKCPVCGMDLEAQRSSGDSKDRYGLRLDQGSIRVANIKTVTAEAVPLVKEIKAIGEISYDEGSLATISAYVDGRIEKLFADYTGVKVEEGDELALLYSPDLYSSQVALLESIKLLREGQSVNQRIIESNQRLYEGARRRLIELGLTEQQVDDLETQREADSRIRLVTPMAGTIIETMAVKGQYVKTGQIIYKVADLSTVWLMLELFPKDAAMVRFGQKVVTRIQSLPGKEIVGRVAFIDPTIDSTTQTVSVRVVVPNEDGSIRVGEFATASILANVNSPGSETAAVYDPDLVGKWISPRHPHIISDHPGKCTECGMDLVPAETLGFASAPPAPRHDVVVPRGAVLMAGDSSVVYVETEPGRFEFRQVVVGQIVGDKVSLPSGIRPGEKVVASATVLLDSQFSLANKPSLIDPNKVERKLRAEQMAALDDLSEFDRHAVLEQGICPVTKLALGSMGTPLSVKVPGGTVWICCKACEQAILDDPHRYLAILKEPRLAGGNDQAGIPQIQALGGLPEMQLPEMHPPVLDASDKAANDEQAIRVANALATLSEVDRQLAEAQKLCPVADFPLGGMGTPVKVEVDGRAVFICCEGCREALLKQPAKYLAKLPKEPLK